MAAGWDLYTTVHIWTKRNQIHQVMVADSTIGTLNISERQRRHNLPVQLPLIRIFALMGVVMALLINSESFL